MLLVDERCQVEWVIGLFLSSNDKRLAIEVSHTDILQGCIK